MSAARTSLLVGLAGTASLLAVACGDDDDDAEPAATSAPPTTSAPAPSTSPTSTPAEGASLEGTTWTLSGDAPLEAPLDDIVVTAVFDAGTLTGHSGCNTYTTPYQTSGDSLTIAPEIAVTAMACPEPQMAVEDEYLERLPRAATYTIDGSTLTLADDDGGSLLVYGTVAGGDAILGAWNVTGYYTEDAITSVVGDVTLTAEFTADRVSGNSGCNQFNGSYTVDGQNITIGPLASTRAACPDDELQQQETDFLAALELAETFQVAGTRLELLRSAGTIAVTFERA
jgi:heat shock protein HslJ